MRRLLILLFALLLSQPAFAYVEQEELDFVASTPAGVVPAAEEPDWIAKAVAALPKPENDKAQERRHILLRLHGQPAWLFVVTKNAVGLYDTTLFHLVNQRLISQAPQKDYYDADKVKELRDFYDPIFLKPHTGHPCPRFRPRATGGARSIPRSCARFPRHIAPDQLNCV